VTDLERRWCDNALRIGGSFVSAFARACYQADDDNLRILRAALIPLMKKYPKYAEGA